MAGGDAGHVHERQAGEGLLVRPRAPSPLRRRTRTQAQAAPGPDASRRLDHRAHDPAGHPVPPVEHRPGRAVLGRPRRPVPVDLRGRRGPRAPPAGCRHRPRRHRRRRRDRDRRHALTGPASERRMERQVRTVTGQRRAPVRERYEYAPESVLPPGETLRETLDALPMSQAELSMRTGLSAKHVNQIVQGVAVLSHDTAIALERATGVPARLWNSLEANYRDYLARKRERDELADQTTWLRQIPVKALRKMGIITAALDDDPTTLQQVLRFFGVVSLSAWESVWRKPGADFRQSQAFDIDVGALATWLRLGELEDQRLQGAPS